MWLWVSRVKSIRVPSASARVLWGRAPFAPTPRAALGSRMGAMPSRWLLSAAYNDPKRIQNPLRSRSTDRSPARWLFPMLALGGLSASFGRVGVWIGLAVCGPLVCYLWWKERGRWTTRRHVRRHAALELIDADEIRLTFEGFQCVRRGRTGRSIVWTEVRGAAAFIEPQGHGDALVLALRIGPADAWIGLSSDVDGFDRLRLALKERFGVPAGWEEAVWHVPHGLNWRRLLGDAPPPGEVCWKCNYDLRGNESGACPECGTVYVWPEGQRGEK